MCPELIVDGENGYLIEREAGQLGDRMEQIAATDVADWRQSCRAGVAHLTWAAAAEKYVTLLSELSAQTEEAA